MITLVLIGVVLAIVLPLTLKKDDDNTYVDAFLTPEKSFFSWDPTKIDDKKYEVSFVLDQKVDPPKPTEGRLGSAPSGTDYNPVNPSNIPLGTNNNLAAKVAV